MLCFNFHHRVVETQAPLLTRMHLLSLTFTIGWLKLFSESVKCLQFLLFNFHHRVVETIKIIFHYFLLLRFNFHHRVVETFIPLLTMAVAQVFNFHHRVVET